MQSIEIKIATGLLEEIAPGDWVMIENGLSFSGFHQIKKVEPLLIECSGVEIIVSPEFILGIYKKISRDRE